MTLRIKEADFAEEMRIFSERLFSQLKTSAQPHLLTPESPLFSFLHPALVKTKILFDSHLELQPPVSVVQGWNFKCYETLESAKINHPGIKSFKGFPWVIHQQLLQQSNDTLIDFGTVGTAFFTRQALEPYKVAQTLTDYQLPLWLEYALSIELWGPAGKWTRFHHRLHTLFEKYDLLVSQDFPGFYPLKVEAQKMESAGFFGQKSETNYTLTLPWDFPLSALIDLENVLLRELSCSS